MGSYTQPACTWIPVNEGKIFTLIHSYTGEDIIIAWNCMLPGLEICTPRTSAYVPDFLFRYIVK